MRTLRFAYVWLVTGLALVAFVLYQTLTPPGPGALLLNDKLMHFGAFTLLMSWFSGVYRPRYLPWIALVLVLLGIGIELLQSRLAYRSAEFGDVLADSGGILFAWVLARAGLGRWAEFAEGLLPPR